MTATAQRFLHADGPGSFRIPTTRTMLPISQVLDRLPGLTRTHKAVLNQVCGLAENGSRKQCDATNPYLAGRLGASERTISRTITDLETRGLLVHQGEGKARRIWPVEALRACYLTTDEAEQDRAILALATVANLDKSGGKPSHVQPLNLDTNLDKSGAEPSQVGVVEPSQPSQVRQPNLDKFGHQPSQVGSRVYRDNQYNQFNTVEEEAAALRSALAAAEKKIGELSAENETLATDNRQLTADLEEVTQQRDSLRNAYLAQRPASHTGGARQIDFSESEFATEAGFRKLAEQMNCGRACVEYYLGDMQVKAAGMPQRDAAGWRNYVHSWLKRERDSTGIVEKMPTPELVGSASKVQQARNGIDEAREIMRRKREGGQHNG